MINKIKLEHKIKKFESLYNFNNGYELLCCPWSTLDSSKIAFISLNPGKPPNIKQLKMISNESGNSYEIDRYMTKSPITEQYLKLCNFLKKKPKEILTGMACPFRGNRWDNFNIKQKIAGLEIGHYFWSKVLNKNISLIIVLSNEATKLIVNLKNAELDEEINSGWGNYKVRRYRNNKNVTIIQLPHLSTFKLFSRKECLDPLKTIFC